MNYSKPNKFKIVENVVIVFLQSKKFGDKECYVSIEDWPRVKIFKWHLTHTSKRNKTHYAKTFLNGKSILMHRLIESFPLDQIDHVNHNGLDNRKENLRTVTSKENSQNKPLYSNNIIGHKGIYRRVYKNGNVAYRARITVDGKLIDLGQADTLEKAVNIRKFAEEKYFISRT